MKPKRVAVFISGYGSNLNVFLQRKHQLGALFVVSSSPDAYGLVRAQEHQVPCQTLSRPIDWDQLQTQLLAHQIDLIFLAGFMRIVPAHFLKQWEGKIFNLHPSLLPKYKGLKAIERAFADGEDVGVSIHHVVPDVDSGEIVLQELAVASVELTTMTLTEVTEKVHQVEHQLVARWIDQYC
jgi:phosphoribosylglycinamide formyltransferase 1